MLFRRVNGHTFIFVFRCNNRGKSEIILLHLVNRSYFSARKMGGFLYKTLKANEREQASIVDVMTRLSSGFSR